MADYSAAKDKKTKRDKASDDEILRIARKRWDAAYEKERSNIAAAYEDLEFLSGAQWDSKIKKEREEEGRPCLTVNQLPQFVHQVTGDIRQMKPAIKVVPVDDQADEKVADIKGGLIRYIENRSDAQAIYFQAADQQVSAGIGHWRIATEYADDSTFLQEIRIGPVDDGIAVLWDNDARLPTREDANWCFVPVDYSHDGFEEAWPDATLSDFSAVGDWANLSQWFTDDHVRVTEYWVKKPIKRTLALTDTGQTIDLTEEQDGYDTAAQVAIMKKAGARIEVRDSFKICRYLMTADEILEGPEEWAGRYIPIIPVIGEEVRIGRKVVRSGIVRHARPVQQMYNYGRSTQTEVFSLQPKAPYMVTEGNVAKYQDVWNTANKKNWPYLPYEPDTKNGGIAPQRIPPPIASQGVNEAVALANEDLRRVIGIYDASLGARSNETSGVAIKARQQEGDVGTFVYIANFARSIRHTGKILIDLIPHVYDSERTIRIMGDDGKIDLLQINQMQMQAGQDGQLSEKIMNDVTVGSYDVVAEAGPSYTTRREEAREGMLEFLKAIPDAAPLVADKIAKAQDFPMADDIAKRLRANLPPAILEAEEAEQQGASPEQIKEIMAKAQQKPPDPEMVKAQMQAELEGQRLQFDQQKAAQEAEVAQATMQMEAQFRQAELAQKAQQAEAELAAKIMLEREKIQSQERIALRTAQMNAEAKAHDAALRADTAKYATDNRPSPKN
jgi:hypothetical protein